MSMSKFDCITVYESFIESWQNYNGISIELDMNLTSLDFLKIDIVIR